MSESGADLARATRRWTRFVASRGISMLGFLAVLLLVAAFAAVLVLESRRKDELAGVADRLGFSYRRGQQAIPADLDRAGFYLFAQGPPLVVNFLEGERSGFTVSLFEYGYDAPTGEEGERDRPTPGDGQFQRHLQTVVWLRSADTRLPDFDLSPTGGAIRRAGARFGLRPVAFDGRDDFRRSYVLLGRDEAAIRRHFSEGVLDRLLQEPGWFAEGRGGQWLVYRVDQRVSPSRTAAWLDDAIALVESLAPE